MIQKNTGENGGKKKNNSNAHDKRYRRLFSNPMIVEELMKYFVDEKFTSDLDFSQMELQNTSFVNEEHKKSEADMIWKINFKGKDVYIYLLIEFQSTVDKYMALRFGSYIFEFYKWLLACKDVDSLPAVFPILIYNGNKPWTAVDNIKDLINKGAIPGEYIPAFRYYKIVENEIPREKLLKIHNALSMVFYVENATAEEIKNGLNELYELLEDEHPTLISEFNLWFNSLLETSGYEMGKSRFTLDKLNSLKEVKTMFTTALKEHEEKYRMIGVREGKLETAKEMLLEGVTLELIAKVTKLPIETIENLRAN